MAVTVDRKHKVKAHTGDDQPDRKTSTAQSGWRPCLCFFAAVSALGLPVSRDVAARGGLQVPTNMWLVGQAVPPPCGVSGRARRRRTLGVPLPLIPQGAVKTTAPVRKRGDRQGKGVLPPHLHVCLKRFRRNIHPTALTLPSTHHPRALSLYTLSFPSLRCDRPVPRLLSSPSTHIPFIMAAVHPDNKSEKGVSLSATDDLCCRQ